MLKYNTILVLLILKCGALTSYAFDNEELFLETGENFTNEDMVLNPHNATKNLWLIAGGVLFAGSAFALAYESDHIKQLLTHNEEAKSLFLDLTTGVSKRPARSDNNKAILLPMNPKEDNPSLSKLNEEHMMRTPEGLRKEYSSGYEPASSMDKKWLSTYLNDSTEFNKNKDSVRIFHSTKTDQKEAQWIMLQREPVNIEGWKAGCADSSRVSHMNEYITNPSEAPLPVGVYARSIMQQSKEFFEVGTLHVPGLAFDGAEQIHYLKYVGLNGNLKPGADEQIREEYQVIAKMVVEGVIFHTHLGEFSGRMLVGAYGANNFVKKLKVGDRLVVRKIIAETLVDEIVNNAKRLKEVDVDDVRLGILLKDSFGFEPQYRKQLQKRLDDVSLHAKGQWIRLATDSKAGDYNVNAWDPNSNVGNGNALDNSLDGYHGRYTTAAFDIHTSNNLIDSTAYIAIE